MILILVAVSALGCNPSARPAMSQAERSAVEDSVRHLAAAFIEADSQGDADRVMRMWPVATYRPNDACSMSVWWDPPLIS